MAKFSTGLRNEMLATGSFKSICDGMIIRIFSGAVPASADDDCTANTLLCTITVNGDGVTGLTFDGSPASGVISKTSTEAWYGTNTASGTASFFRMCKSADDNLLSSTEERIQGTIALAGGDLYFSNLSLASGNQQAIDYFSVALPTT